jgi:hypothetical protein
MATLLVQQMAADGRFRGEKGEKGEKGDPGADAVLDMDRLVREVAAKLPPWTFQLVGEDGKIVLDTYSVPVGGVLKLQQSARRVSSNSQNQQ